MTHPVRLMSVRDQIASRLRTEVRDGLLAAGSPVREEQLAARFGVSRTPIRQVLQQLTYEGLLVSRPNCSMVVAEPPSPEIAAVLYDCRARLEAIALRECFVRLNDEDFDRWNAILADMYGCCERSDAAGAFHYDMLFHRAILEKSSPAGSIGVYSAIATATRDYVRIEGNRPPHEDLRELYALHAALLVVFRHGDVHVACEAISQHILRQNFNREVCRCWAAAGKPYGLVDLYREIIPMLRRDLSRSAAS